MPQLSNPTLRIELVAGTTKVKVSGTVHVTLDAFEEALVKQLGLKFRARCLIMGEDSGFNGADDQLFRLPSKIVTSDGTIPFFREVDRSKLDEDWEGNDEIFAHYTCASTTSSFSLAATPKNSITITGNF